MNALLLVTEIWNVAGLDPSCVHGHDGDDFRFPCSNPADATQEDMCTAEFQRVENGGKQSDEVYLKFRKAHLENGRWEHLVGLFLAF